MTKELKCTNCRSPRKSGTYRCSCCGYSFNSVRASPAPSNQLMAHSAPQSAARLLLYTFGAITLVFAGLFVLTMVLMTFALSGHASSSPVPISTLVPGLERSFSLGQGSTNGERPVGEMHRDFAFHSDRYSEITIDVSSKPSSDPEVVLYLDGQKIGQTASSVDMNSARLIFVADPGVTYHLRFRSRRALTSPVRYRVSCHTS